ncbi:hypothetical protein EDB80DRAFT_884546 [Ilyonectria destructans]|nr:hypothetical protein EDB80DRAFT_880172 [Ilyonectria destructans]KAH6984018.1 hypothetical protein EDB80DRAFT_884546 [Ilyonectria destructans]
MARDTIKSYAIALNNAQKELKDLAKGKKLKQGEDIRVHTITIPEGDPHWKEKKWKELQSLLEVGSEFSEFITPKLSTIEKGIRITGPRLQGILDQVNYTMKDAEIEILKQIVFNREAAFAWEFDECGKVDPIVAPPQVSKVAELLKLRIKRGILEESHASYRNPFMLVAKKNVDIRLVNSAIRINKHTIRDGLIPPGTEEFSSDVAVCKMLSHLDSRDEGSRVLNQTKEGRLSLRPGR